MPGVLELMVSSAPPEVFVGLSVMLVTLRNALRPDAGVRLRMTVPVNPLDPVTMMVEVAFGAAFVPPIPSEAFAGTSGPTLVGLAAMLKVAPAVVTTWLAVAVWAGIEVSVTVKVTVNDPALA